MAIRRFVRLSRMYSMHVQVYLKVPFTLQRRVCGHEQRVMHTSQRERYYCSADFMFGLTKCTKPCRVVGQLRGDRPAG